MGHEVPVRERVGGYRGMAHEHARNGIDGTHPDPDYRPGPPALAGAQAMTRLPNDLLAFTGSEEALRQMTAALTSLADSPVALVVAGMPGLGKTTLITHWAHQVKDRFPDGQIYLNLDG